MKRLFPPSQFWPTAVWSPWRPICGSSCAARHTPHATRHSARGTGAAFTLIELLVVISIIAVLAALTLSTLGYVNKKGAESRAVSEVAALSSAIEAFKLDFGSYPASNNLYSELTGGGPRNTNRVLFEPTPSMATNKQFIDPWGNSYGYISNASYFELWSTAGGTDTNKYIRN